ncbi:hypothetical protein LTR36_008984 [Oleoguttula mirabilis]|uniref:Uncharacterized protein n=1 Tax=Oleoguttula mirabilis TaxID=1507867 RepID=A0AAV9J7E6_9PEZI|nr:hypothetical protein LTR36_008984 [Oleoguttula mirabilis]
MQSTRMAATMLRAQPAMSMLRAQQATRGFRTSSRTMMPMPKQEQSGSARPAHTVSQRIRSLKKIPPELIPLGIVLAVAIGAAGYSLGRKLYVDGTLRLRRQGPEANKH